MIVAPYSFLEQKATLAAPTFVIRTDIYSASVRIAMPGTNFSAFAMDNWYSDISANVRTTGVNYPIIPSGSGTGAARGIWYASGSGADANVNSGSYNFASNGYTTSMFTSGSMTQGALSGSIINFGTSNFVVETWFNLKSALTQPPFNILFFGDFTGNTVLMDYSNANSVFRFFTNGTGLNSSVTNVPKTQNQWNHVAFVRSGNNKYIYFNGSRIGSVAWSTSITSAPFWTIAGSNSGNANDGPAKLFQDFRITIGSDRGYSGATITPPNSIVTTI